MQQASNVAERIEQLSEGLMQGIRPTERRPDCTEVPPTEAAKNNADTLIVTPLSWDHVYKRAMASAMAMEKPRTGSIWIDGDTIDDMRCKAVTEARERGFRWIFFADADMVLPKDALTCLRARNLPIVGGLCRQRKDPFHATTFKLNDEGWLVWWPPTGETGLVKVDATGAACLLIDMQVFDAIDKKFPHLAGSWFLDARRLPGLKPQEKVSEDLWFCMLARAAGYDIYVDLDVVCGHLVMGEIIDDGTPEHNARVRLE